MANNRELAEFSDFVTVDESGNNSVGIGTSVIISEGGLVVGTTLVIGDDGTWKGSGSGLTGAQAHPCTRWRVVLCAVPGPTMAPCTLQLATMS